MTSEYNGTLTWALLDLDCTLAEGMWFPHSPSDAIGQPLPGVQANLQALVDAGLHPIIWTARPSSHYKAIKRWLRTHGLWEFFNHDAGPAILTGKPLAAVIVDDKNAGGLRWPCGLPRPVVG